MDPEAYKEETPDPDDIFGEIFPVATTEVAVKVELREGAAAANAQVNNEQQGNTSSEADNAEDDQTQPSQGVAKTKKIFRYHNDSMQILQPAQGKKGAAKKVLGGKELLNHAYGKILSNFSPWDVLFYKATGMTFSADKRLNAEQMTLLQSEVSKVVDGFRTVLDSSMTSLEDGEEAKGATFKLRPGLSTAMGLPGLYWTEKRSPDEFLSLDTVMDSDEEDQSQEDEEEVCAEFDQLVRKVPKETLLSGNRNKIISRKAQITPALISFVQLVDKANRGAGKTFLVINKERDKANVKRILEDKLFPEEDGVSKKKRRATERMLIKKIEEEIRIKQSLPDRVDTKIVKEVDLTSHDFTSDAPLGFAPHEIDENGVEVVVEGSRLMGVISAQNRKVSVHVCWKCGKGFLEPKHKSRHEAKCRWLRHHNPKVKDEFLLDGKKVRMRCPQPECRNRDRFLDFDSLLAHFTGEHMRPEDVPTFFCYKCAKTFMHTQSRNDHIRKKCAPQYACDMCERKFSTPSLLHHHRTALHLGIHEFQCDLCGWKTKRREYLNQHLEKEHNIVKETNHTCFCEECGKGFRTLYHLNSHKKFRHSAEALAMREAKKNRVILCDKCDFTTNSQTNMNYHKRRVHDYVPMICPDCGLLMKHAQGLRNHMAKMHGPKAGEDRANKVPWSDKRREFQQQQLRKEITLQSEDPMMKRPPGGGEHD